MSKTYQHLIFNYLNDGNGKVTSSCDNSGIIRDKLSYFPFGKQTSGEKQQGALANSPYTCVTQ